MNKERIKSKLVDALAIMDEKGRLNSEGNSYMLWEADWVKLRDLIYDCFEMVDKTALDKIMGHKIRLDPNLPPDGWKLDD